MLNFVLISSAFVVIFYFVFLKINNHAPSILNANAYQRYIEKLKADTRYSKNILSDSWPIIVLLFSVFYVLVIFDHILFAVLFVGTICPWPIFQIKRAHYLRQKKVMQRFPFFLELCSLCIESGMDLFQAIDEIIQLQPSHPLSADLQHILTQLSIGVSREEALKSFSRKNPFREIYQWTTAVNHALELGSPLSELSKNQCLEIYSARKYNMEARIQKIPLKLLFPLVLLIFPLFVIIFAPLLFQMLS